MKVVYITNVFDPETREKNKITSDSPAAFNKVINVSNGIKLIKHDISIISMGIFNSCKKNVSLQNRIINKIPLSYIKLPRNKILRHIVIQIKLPLHIIMTKVQGIIFYNYGFDYFMAVCICLILKKAILLDIEDGINDIDNSLANVFRKIILKFYLFCSKHKAILVSSLLKCRDVKKYHVVYNTGELIPYSRRDTHKKLTVLFSGTILIETGGLLIIELLESLAEIKDSQNKFEIHICGKWIEPKAKIDWTRYPFAKFHGFVSEANYRELLRFSDIGLVLKSNDNFMGRTTFPSKLVEYAMNRLAIMAIPSSDLPLLFDKNEIIFVNNIKEVVRQLEYFSENRNELEDRKKQIAEKASIIFDAKTVGGRIMELLNND